MKSKALFLPFQLPRLRCKARSSQQILAEQIQRLKQKSFSQLGECLGKFIPARYLHPAPSGALSRRRIYSKENTFWAFFSQVLDADGGCKDVVRKLQAFAALKVDKLPSSSTAAYCKARQKLEQTTLESILKHTTEGIQAVADPDRLHGCRVIVVVCHTDSLGERTFTVKHLTSHRKDPPRELWHPPNLNLPSQLVV